MVRQRRKASLESRFRKYVVESKRGGHWLWKGSTTEAGFGKIFTGTKWTTAHRLSWELVHGSLSSVSFVQHTCRKRLCVNPEHLKVIDTTGHLEKMRIKHVESLSAE